MKKGKVDLLKYQDDIERRRKIIFDELAGREGLCFIEGRKVIKIYDDPVMLDMIHDLSDYYSPKIAFPKFYIYKKNQIYGEVMPYFTGKTIDLALTLRSNVNRLLFNYNDIKREMALFSDILMADLQHVKNILYTPKDGFKIIDTTSWVNNKIDQNNVNFHLFDDALFYVFKNLVFENSDSLYTLKAIKNEYWYLKSRRMGRDILELLECNLNNDYHIQELIEAYQEFIRIYYNYDMETIGDMKKYTKLFKKS